MGEEWGRTQPFPFFCDFHDELARPVRDGRRREFARFAEFQDPALREKIPDPNALSTFAQAVLDWRAPESSGRARLARLLSRTAACAPCGDHAFAAAHSRPGRRFPASWRARAVGILVRRRAFRAAAVRQSRRGADRGRAQRAAGPCHRDGRRGAGGGTGARALACLVGRLVSPRRNAHE